LRGSQPMKVKDKSPVRRSARAGIVGEVVRDLVEL
jgi:hypothetical protein